MVQSSVNQPLLTSVWRPRQGDSRTGRRCRALGRLHATL